MSKTVSQPAEDLAALPDAAPRQTLWPSRAGLRQRAGTVIPAYLFGLAGLANAFSVYGMLQGAPDGESRQSISALLVIAHPGLAMIFNLTVCWLFLARRPALDQRNQGGWIADVIAVIGTVSGLVLSVGARTATDPIVIAAAELLMLVGLLVMLVGVASLGRSFGIMPRARGLVRTGLYRWVRHPIYLGEFLSFGGLLVLTLSPVAVAVFGAFVFLQLYRLMMEERALADAYPEYDAYRASTARLLPGIY